jgi:O-antigen/teichoic acid export membrane protein
MSQPFRSRGFGENALWNAAGAFSSVVVTLTVVPIYLRVLGLEQFGIVAVIATVTGPLSIFNGGVAQGAIKQIAQSIGAGEPQTAPGILAAAWLLNCAVGLVGAVVCVVGGPWIVRLFGVSQPIVSDAQWALSIAGGSWIMSQMSATFRSGIEGTRDQLAVLKADVAFLLLSSVLCVVAVVQFGSIVAYASAQLVAQFGIFWIWRGLWLRRFPETELSVHVAKRYLARIWSHSKWQVGTSAIALFANYGDRYLIGLVFSAQTLGLYNIGLRLQATVRLSITVFSRALFPAISSTSHESQKAEAMFVRAVSCVGLVACLLIGLAAVGAPTVLQWWLGAAAADSLTVTVQLLFVHLLFECPSSFVDSFLNGMGRPRSVMLGSVLVLILTVAIMVPAGLWGGMNGVVWGALTAYALAKCIVAFRASRKAFSFTSDKGRLLRSIYGAPLAAASAVASIMLFEALVPREETPLAAGATVAGYLVIVSLAMLMVPECRKAVHELVQRLRPQRL